MKGRPRVAEYAVRRVIAAPTVSVILVLVLGLTAFYLRTRGVDPAHHQQVIDTLLRFRQSAVEINEQVLTIRRLEHHNYDELVRIQRQLSSHLQRMQQIFANGSGGDVDGLLLRLAAIRAAEREKARLVEEIKSSNALLKNSLNFLPTGGLHARAEIEQDPRLDAAERDGLVEAVHLLLLEVLSYNLTADAERLPEIARQQGVITETLGRHPGSGEGLPARLVAHTQIVLSYRNALARLIDELVAVPLVPLSVEFEQAYLQDHAGRQAIADHARLAMFVISLLLLGYIGWIISRLHLQTRELTHALGERQAFQDALFREKELAELTLESIGGGVITCDLEGRVDFLNPVAERITGWGREQARGRPLDEVLRLFHEQSGTFEERLERLCLQLGDTLRFDEPMAIVARDGSRMPVRFSIAPISDHGGHAVGVVAVFQDVGHEQRLELQLQHQATHDALTGLINRAEFEQVLTALLGEERGGASHAMLYLDLDQFKLVNDTAGHQLGDQLLQQVARRLPAHLQANDLVARLGGDEFGVLLYGADETRAEEVARKLLRVIPTVQIERDGRSVGVGVSIGIILIDHTIRTLPDVMGAVDIACFAAKEQGRNRFHLYRPEDRLSGGHHGVMQWVAQIRDALERDRFVLYAQAITRLDDGVVEHYEVLLRMLDEDGEVIPPGRFMPAAERYGLMPELDRWVIRRLFTLCHEARRRHGAEGVPIFAVNLSGGSFNDSRFSDFLDQALDNLEMPPSGLCFEITETMAIHNLEHTIHFIQEYRRLGCHFSLDDFGSGLSSFGYLKNLPVDYLKIDGGFVHDMLTNPIDQSTIAAINSIGHILRLRTIAEWVEDEPTKRRLVEIGVDCVQGNHLHRPQPVEEILGLES